MGAGAVHDVASGRFSQSSASRRSINQFVQIANHKMSAVTPELLSIALTRNTDHQPKISMGAGLDTGNRILNYDRSYRLNAEEPCRQQERIGGGFAGKSLRIDHIAIDLHLEELVQLGGLEHGRAVLTRGDHGNSEPNLAQSMDE